MPRPHKHRTVAHIPECRSFQPAGHHRSQQGEVKLFWEELEALRLKDLEGLDQIQAAERMEVSRPTFQRILRSARKKIAQALIESLTIRIEGGHFRLASRSLRCRECGHKWQEENHGERHGSHTRQLLICPNCGSNDISIRRRKTERHSQ